MASRKRIAGRAASTLLATTLMVTAFPAPALAEVAGVADPAALIASQAQASSEDAEAAAAGARALGELAQQQASASAAAEGAAAEDGAAAGGAAAAVGAAAGGDAMPQGGAALQDGAAADAAAGADEAATVVCALSVTGPDASGASFAWVPQTELKVAEGSTAAQATEQLLDQAGLTYDASESSWGWSLNTITSEDGRTLGYDAATGKYWQLFVNGKSSDLGAGSVVLKAGDSIQWRYAAYGEQLPAQDVEVVPDAERPSLPSEWPGFANGGSGALTQAATPTESASLAWVLSLKSATDWSTSMGEPILVGGNPYVAVGSELRAIDAGSGAVRATAKLAAPIDSVARMVYADGIIVVPLHGGRLQALTADTLTTVWLTDTLPAHETAGDQQALSTLTVLDGRVYFGTAAADWTKSYAGYYACVSLATGTVLWTSANTTSGYYWAGAARVGSKLVIADDSGTVAAFDALTGAVTSTLSLGASARSTVVALDATHALVVTKDGVLHKLSLSASGTLAEDARVSFAAYSTCTPTVVGGRAYVGGSLASYKGVLAVIDLASMTVERTVAASDGAELPAEVKSTPAVSVQAGGTYVYFTCNAEPGGVYAWGVGEDEAHALYTPAGELANYCMASVIAAADGSLYYTNDSGSLFKLVASAVVPSDPSEPSEPSEPAQPGAGENAGGSSKPASKPSSGTKKQAKISLSGNKAQVADDNAAPEDEDAQAKEATTEDAANEAATPVATAAGQADGTANESKNEGMPAWPLVGMGVGAAVLVAAVVALLKRKGAK